jgi:hypothetical protein
MIGAIKLPYQWRWAGLVSGVVFWYAAHDLSFYFSAYNCGHPWLLPFIHLVALAGCLYGGLLSLRTLVKGQTDSESSTELIAGVSTASAVLFALVILWQGIATLVFHGCQR